MHGRACKRSASRRSVRSRVRLTAVALTLVLGFSAGAGPAAASAAPAGAEARKFDALYRYDYGLGFHPFTAPQAVRAQLTGHFWLFPVSGECGATIQPLETCALLGGNPVTVEAVERDHFQIRTLPGHSLGAGLHIRFSFASSAGLHRMTVRAWQTTGCGDAGACGPASSALAWTLWRVLAETLAISAYLA